MVERKDAGIIRALRLSMLEEIAGELPEGLAEAIDAYLNIHLQDGTCLCALMKDGQETVGKAMLCLSIRDWSLRCRKTG